MRRIFLPQLAQGEIQLDQSQAHYLRDVLRLKTGSSVEAFNGKGIVGKAEVLISDPNRVVLKFESLEAGKGSTSELTIASAIPKGNRADWMIEKLSEVGTDIFVPLICARSVVVPAGTGKSDRWGRIAGEASRESGRADVMEIEPVTKLDDLLQSIQARAIPTWFLSMKEGADLASTVFSKNHPQAVLLIGPEGGWTNDEISRMKGAGVMGLRLTDTVLRVETAAALAAGMFKSIQPSGKDQ